MMSVGTSHPDDLPAISQTDLSGILHTDLSHEDFSETDLRITIPLENQDDYSDEFDTDLEDTDMTDGLCKRNSGYRDTGLGTDSYRQACQRLKIPPVKIAQGQLWCKHLELRHVGLGPKDAKALAFALSKNCQVQNLDLAENTIGPGVGYIIDMLRTNMHISVLNLASNDIDGQAASAIGELLYSDLAVTDLNLANNHLKDLGCQYICHGLQGNSILRRLNLSGNEISIGGVQAMAKAMCENTTLISLDLSWNHIRQRAAVLLCKGMQSNHGILSLNVSWNGFGFEGSLALKKLFGDNDKLRKMDLTNNRINWEGASFLAMGLSENKTLEILKLGQNPLTMDGCYKILESVSHSSSKIRFISFQEIPIDSRVAFKAEDIARFRDFNISHGGIVFTKDVFGTPFKKETGLEDPVSLLRRFMSRRGIRVIDLFRIFDTKDRQMVSKENFIRGLKRIQAPLDEEEMEEVSKHFLKTDNYITFRDLADGVRKNFQKQQRHDWKEEFQEKKRKEEHRRILAPSFTSVVLPAIQYFSQPVSYTYSTPVTRGPSTRSSTAMPGRKTRASVSFGDLRRTPRTQVEILPPLRTPTPSIDNSSRDISFDDVS